MKKTALLVFSLSLLVTSFGQVERKVVVEHFTNTRCSICASRNPALFELLDNYPQVLHIAFHPSSPYTSCLLSQHNPSENDGRTYFYDIYGGTPRIVLQGNVTGFQNPILNASQLDSELGQTSDYAIIIEQDEPEDKMVDVSVSIKKVSGSNQDNLNLYAAIVEKYIDYSSPNGENGHHNVFRKILTDEPVSLNESGEEIFLEKSYQLDEEWEESQIYILAILQDPSTMEIFQAGNSENLSGGPSFIGESKEIVVNNVFYPNPATDILQVHTEYHDRFVSAVFYNMYGQLMGETTLSNNMNISNLSPGHYIVRLKDRQDNPFFTRILKR